MGCNIQSTGKIHLVILGWNRKPKNDWIIIYLSSRWTKKVRQKVYSNNCCSTLIPRIDTVLDVTRQVQDLQVIPSTEMVAKDDKSVSEN